MINGAHILTSWQDPSFGTSARHPLHVEAGRGIVQLLDHPRGKVVERAYRHGGMRRIFFPHLFLKSDRPQQELIMHRKAFQGGVATVEPVGWREERALLPLLRRYYFYTAYLPGASPLPTWVRQSGIGSRICKEMAGILHGLYQLKVFHADLNLNNWLIAQDRLFLIDFDKAREVDWHGEHFLLRAISRIARSGKKLGLLQLRFSFFRLVVLSARRFELSPRSIIERLSSELGRVSRLDRIRWKLSGGHQNSN